MSAKPEPRIVNGRKHDFFVVDNPVIDQKIEEVEAKRRADVGWTYTVLCRLASNETGEATLRISYLEKKTGRSKPVLIKCLKWLQKLELLAVRKNREGGRQSASTYVLLTVSRVKDDNSESEVQSKQEQKSRVNTDYRSTKTVSPTKTVTPTGQAEPASSAPKSWEEARTGERQAYLIAYLHNRMVERELDPPSPRQKERLSGELRTHIERGRTKADLLFALDHMVEASRRGVTLELYQAISDADGKVRHLRAVDNHDKPSREGGGLESLSDKMKRLGVEA